MSIGKIRERVKGLGKPTFFPFFCTAIEALKRYRAARQAFDHAAAELAAAEAGVKRALTIIRFRNTMRDADFADNSERRSHLIPEQEKP